jgi:hypothetical protein
MDIEGRLHSAHRRSHMTMTKSVQNAWPAGSIRSVAAGAAMLRGRLARSPVTRTICRLTILLMLMLSGPVAGPLVAQVPAETGPQELTFAGLRAGPNPALATAQINAVRVGPQGNLYLLLDQKDGVRLLETDPTASTLLAETQLGAAGDIGIAMALDPAGNVYITGTTSSGTLASTSGAAFPNTSGAATNSFVAKFNSSLNSVFVTFAGSAYLSASSIAASADAVFITGTIFSSTLPVTSSAIIQAPAYASTQNGFVEKFSASGSSLLYATYLSGAGGGTTASAIAVDSSGNAYIAGTTTSPGYPTIAAVVPEMLGATSGFLTRLTPAGDGITFSTYLPGAGISSMAIDTAANNLLISGSISLGQFPVATVSMPLAGLAWQVLLRMPLDGSSVLTSTVLAPGTQSVVAPGGSGTAWVAGSMGLPILPLQPLSPFGNSFAVHLNSAGVVDQAARFGGIAASNPGDAGAPVSLTSLAADAVGNAFFAGSFAPYASQSLLATQTFDLPLTTAPTAAFPSTVRAAVLPASACNGSLCSGSAAYLAKLTLPASLATAAASLGLSFDDAPNLTLRNLGSAEATGLQIAVAGFTFATNCGSTLAAAGECSIALSGAGPGSIAVSAANAVTQAQTLPAISASVSALPVVFSPKQLDFGIVSSASGTVSRTITVSNLTQQSQTFTSTLDTGAHSSFPFTFAETSSDCAIAGVATRLLAPGAVCHIAIGLTASNSSINDGPVQQNWLIGTRDVQMTAYVQAAALSLSSSEVDFGTQYTGGLRLPRYLYLSNNSTTPIAHSAVTLPGSSPFTATDGCPDLLEPGTVCQLQLAYHSSHAPSADAVTLSLDQGLTALITGRSLPQPAAGGASVNPSLSVSATSLAFTNPVPVTSISSGTQTVTLSNTGASAFTLALSLSGDFTDATSCGASLAAGASCSVVLTFAPSQPGTRQGILAVGAGSSFTPAYVTLTGVGTGILAPSNNGTLDFGGVVAGQPSVQWYKITQPFTSFSAVTAPTTLGAPYTVILVEDIGYGHGQPPDTAFSTSASGTCLNCWLGVEFTPTAAGLETGTLTLASSSSGSPYVLALTGQSLPLTGLLLSPVSQDFGPVPVNGTTASSLFALTNLVPGASPVSVSTPILTGDFAVQNTPSGGPACGGTLAYTASCFIQIALTPTTTGPRTGSLTVQAAGVTASAALTGYGSPDPGLSLNPAALIFNNVPGTSSTLQSIALTNTSAVTEQIGAPAATSSTIFTVTSNCATLPPAATCSIAITFIPQTGPVTGTLAIPVTASIGGTPALTSYTVPLTGGYTSEDAGLQIIPASAEYGPQATASTGVTRQFTINNLTAKSLALSIALPRQFVLSGDSCSGLAPNASCNFSVTFLPLTNGDLTGTLFAEATPTDGSPTLNGLGYVEGYGIGSATLAISGSLQPGSILNFGQIPSGQSAQQTLTLTNTSATLPLTIRRLTAQWPFLSTTTCGATLVPAASCTVLLTYAPINQVAIGSSSAVSVADSGTLVIESDAASSPDLIDLTGSSTPAVLASPSNTAPLAALTPSQSSLSFANTAAGGSSAPQTVTLANTGSATITILGIQTSTDFTVASNCTAIVPGASCTLTVTFTPQSLAQGTRIGAVEISSNASTSLEFISVVGVSSSSTLSVAPASLSFGTVLVGASSSLTVQLTNNSSTPASIGSLSTTGDYTASLGSCPSASATLPAGATCSLQVTFAPTQSGTRTGTLAIANSVTAQPLSVALTGTGIQSHLQITPSSVAFGAVAVGASSSLSLTLTNTGTAAITGISLASTGDYAVTTPCSLANLAPQASCAITIAFTPSAAGTRTGSLTITSSDPTSPTAVALTGTGTITIIVVSNATFTLAVASSSSASATVPTGSPATYTLAVTPLNGFNGTVVLNCTPIAPATYASCSLLPSSVILASTQSGSTQPGSSQTGPTQTSVATINTVTEVANRTDPATRRRSLGDTLLCLLFPTLIFSWKARTSRHRAWRIFGPIAWAMVASVALLSAGGCGGNTITSSNLRFAPAGSYQYQVTASSTSGSVAISQTVTLNLIVQ